MKQKIVEIYMDDADSDHIRIQLENVLPDNPLAQAFFEKFMQIAQIMKEKGDEYNKNNK